MKKYIFTVAVLLCSFSLIQNVAFAGDDWNAPEGRIEAGVQYHLDNDDKDSAKFNEFREVSNGFEVGNIIINWEPAENIFFELDASDVGQDDQNVSFIFGKRYLWNTVILWDENPNHYGDEAWSVYNYKGNGVFTLPDDIQNNDAVWNWENAVEDGIHEVELGYRRKTGSIGFNLTPTENWTLSFLAERERRTGTHHQAGGSYRSDAQAELAAPVDYETDNISIAAEYASDMWSVGGNYLISKFHNEYKSITWDHMLFPVDGINQPSRFRQSMSPDSDLQQWSINGSLNLPGKTRIYALISQSETEQNDDFLPMTINGTLMPGFVALDPSFDMPNDLDGSNKRDVLSLSVISRPIDWLSLKAFWNSNEFDNDSRIIEFPGYVNSDHSVSGTARKNLLYAYEKENWGFSAGFHFIDWMSFSIGYDELDMERDYAAVTDSTEDTIKLSVDVNATDWLFLRATYKNQNRESHDYYTHYNQEGFLNSTLSDYENYGLRRFYWTDRDRDYYDIMLQISPNDIFEIYGQLTYWKNDYDHTPQHHLPAGEDDDLPQLGRMEDKTTSWTIGFSFAPSKRFSGWVDYTKEQYDMDMDSKYRQTPANPNDENGWWGLRNDETSDVFTLGFDAVLVSDILDLNGSLSVSDSDAKSDYVWIEGGHASSDPEVDGYPVITDKLTVAYLNLEYHIRSNFDIGFRYWYEEWEGEDWAVDTLTPYYAVEANNTYLGARFEDYTNHVLSIMAAYSF